MELRVYGPFGRIVDPARAETKAHDIRQGNWCYRVDPVLPTGRSDGPTVSGTMSTSVRRLECCGLEREGPLVDRVPRLWTGTGQPPISVSVAKQKQLSPEFARRR